MQFPCWSWVFPLSRCSRRLAVMGNLKAILFVLTSHHDESSSNKHFYLFVFNALTLQLTQMEDYLIIRPIFVNQAWLPLFLSKSLEDLSHEFSSKTWSPEFIYFDYLPAMRNSFGRTFFLLLLLLLLHSLVVMTLVSAQGPNKTTLWPTLSGLCFAQSLFLLCYFLSDCQ